MSESVFPTRACGSRSDSPSCNRAPIGNVRFSAPTAGTARASRAARRRRRRYESNGMSRSLLPEIVRLTPSNYSDYLWCPRLFYISALLGIPPSDTPFRSADQGLLVHDVLERVHTNGSCRDDVNIKAALGHFDADTPQMRGFVERHSKRCPQEFEREAHEV